MKCHVPLDPPNLKLDFSSLLHAVGKNFLHLSLVCTRVLYMDMFSMPQSAVMLPRARGNGAALPSPLGVDIQQDHTVQVSEVLGLISAVAGLKSH